MEYPLWVWIFFFAVVLIALFVDVGIVNRNAHTPTRRETFAWSAVWISLALLFNVFVFWMVGSYHGSTEGLHKATEFIFGYLVELSLSVDNLFVFLLIFNFFKVPKKFQHRVLFWGILMALVLRMVMIFAGTTLIKQFEWLIYIFGAFLLYTGVKMFSDDDESFNPEESAVVKLTTRFIPISKDFDGENFFTVKDGKRTGTLLLLVLIVINLVDLVFTVDSIPVIIGVTHDPFIIYTSNIFAILGLRTFFFLLVDMEEKFHLLKYGLAFVLTLIGVKMLLPLVAEGVLLILGHAADTSFAQFLHVYVKGDYKQQETFISLAIVAAALALSVLLSLKFPPKEKNI